MILYIEKFLHFWDNQAHSGLLYIAYENFVCYIILKKIVHTCVHKWVSV